MDISKLPKIPKTIHAAIPLLWDVGILAAVYLLLDWSFKRLTQLPLESYKRPFVAFETLKNFESPVVVLTAIAVLVLLALRWKLISTPWSSFEGGTEIRILIVSCILALTWAHTTYSLNYFYDQSHLIDRLIILIFAILVMWRPIFVLPFLLITLPIVHQFREPLRVYTWSLSSLPFRIVILFAAQLLICFASKKPCWKVSSFVFFLLCLVAGHHLPSGLSKLNNGWLQVDHLYFLLPSTYANGWLGFLEPDSISRITSILAHFNWPMKIATIILEGGAVVFLWRRPFIRVFLIGWLFIHAELFLRSGIGMWMWVVPQLILLFIFFWEKSVFSRSLANFSVWHLVASLVIIGSATKWLRPPIHAWIDSRANYTYKFEATDEEGNIFSLPPNFFLPYYYDITLSGFHYIHDRPIMNITWGSIGSVEFARLLTEATTEERILELEKARGRSKFSQQSLDRFKNFIQVFIRNKNSNPPKQNWLKKLSAPPGIITFSSPNLQRGKHPIKNVTIHQLLSFYDGEAYREIRSVPVLSIDIPKDH